MFVESRLKAESVFRGSWTLQDGGVVRARHVRRESGERNDHIRLGKRNGSWVPMTRSLTTQN